LDVGRGGSKGIPFMQIDTLAEQLKDGLASVQKAYEHRRAQLEESIAALDREHAEWTNADDGDKWRRLRIVANLAKEGEDESVYSERVKLWSTRLIATLEVESDAARKRLASRHRK
jgi:hypothetical protein